MIIHCSGYFIHVRFFSWNFIALNEALKDELQWLKIAAGQVTGAQGNNRGSSSQFSSHPQNNRYFSNHHVQQQQQQEQQLHNPNSNPNNPRLGGQSQPSFRDFNQRVWWHFKVTVAVKICIWKQKKGSNFAS